MKYRLRLAPKTKRNLSRILPFGIIWWACALVFFITEMGVTRYQNLNPETDITLSLPVIIFAHVLIFFIGLLVGTLEMVYLEKRFRHLSLRRKISYKFGIYFFLFLLVILTAYPIAACLESGLTLTDPQVWQKTGRFLGSLTFLTTLFQLSVSLFVSLVYSAISENLGHHVFLNFFTGKYHKPVVETRIFMFLDMKSSTSIAEKLGHVRYFQLLQEYYDLMSEPIINCEGEVYQYIGDEIVTSWRLDKGLAQANCIRCFFEIAKKMEEKQSRFKSEHGVEVGFKAGLHFGEVTIGEVGALKKEIVFTGDVLNTTARIQSMCNELHADLLISEKLNNALLPHTYSIRSCGVVSLRGKDHKEELFQVISP
ncbi:MAG: adenylate/guanylate cyclase domain-containing protein [Ekhidna sp.]